MPCPQRYLPDGFPARGEESLTQHTLPHEAPPPPGVTPRPPDLLLDGLAASYNDGYGAACKAAQSLG